MKGRYDPAFPTARDLYDQGLGGMTLGQYYAGCILQGMLASRPEHQHTITSGGATQIAKETKLILDALFEEEA